MQPYDCLNRDIQIEIRNDNDSRFVAKSVQTFFAENNLNQVFTHPYTPQENGHIESLYDMHGNLWQWCIDWYDDYPGKSQTNPTGPETGTDRVYRGGSWGSYAADCRSAYRYDAPPSCKSSLIGFRVVRNEE